jgi:hypothetical protein
VNQPTSLLSDPTLLVLAFLVTMLLMLLLCQHPLLQVQLQLLQLLLPLSTVYQKDWTQTRLPPLLLRLLMLLLPLSIQLQVDHHLHLKNCAALVDGTTLHTSQGHQRSCE